MQDHLVSGVAWVSFPVESHFRWWIITTRTERTLMFQHGDDEPVRLALGERDALGILRLIGEATGHPNLERANV